MGKKRVDRLLVEMGYFSSRERAQRALLEGKVRVDGRLVDKASFGVKEDAVIEVAEDLPYVSRGGLKLAHAIDVFGVSVDSKIALDVGASTGGFTDCLLKRGASKVYAVDVGYGQLAWKLRQDPRVVVMERTNARYLKEEDISDKVDILVMDLSFISVKKVLPSVLVFLSVDFKGMILLKPQFEVGREFVGKGVVKDPELHYRVLSDFREFVLKNMPFELIDVCYSPIKGAKGNIEFFALIGKGQCVSLSKLQEVVKEAHERL